MFVACGPHLISLKSPLLTPTPNKQISIYLSTPTTMTTAAPTAAETELKTYWCHECDMSVSLTHSTPLLCPHCHTHFLELIDSPLSQNDAESLPLPPSSLFDVVFQNQLLLFPPPPSKTHTEKTLPIITVTPTLLSLLDSNGVVLCAVCKDPISVDEEAKQLPCHHLYHSDCITPWLCVQSSCPLCRFRIDEEDDDCNGEGDDEDEYLSASDVMRQMVTRLSELSEDDYYGLTITLNHIASRHAVLQSNASGAGENLDANSDLGGVVDEDS